MFHHDVLPGDHDQTVPIGVAALKTIKLFLNGTLKNRTILMGC